MAMWTPPRASYALILNNQGWFELRALFISYLELYKVDISTGGDTIFNNKNNY